MRERISRRVCIGSIAAGFAVAPVALAQAGQRADLTPVLIEVPKPENLQFLTLWVALGAGFFEQEGLAPRIVVARERRSTGELLLAGRADVALLPPPMFLGMMAEEKPIQLFASLLANEPINLIVRREIAEAHALSTSPTLQSRLQSLKGIRIGLAEEVTPRLKALAAAAGLEAERDFVLVTVSGPEQVDALVGGMVDGLFAHTPYLETALVEHEAVLVADTSSGAVAQLAGGQIHALATTRSWVERKPELIASVTKAIAQAQYLIHSDPMAAVDALIVSGAAGQDRRELETILSIYAPAVPQTPRISIEGIVRDATLYPAHPRAPDFSQVEVSDYVAPQFAQGAIRPR